jgi:hypothetical protein
MSYFSQVGNFYTRLNNMDEIDSAIRMVREQKQQAFEAGEVQNNETFDEIVNFMQQHQAYIRDPGPQYTNLTGLGFLEYLGGNISSALVNFYQLPTATAGMLTGEYGPKANAHIAGNLLSVHKIWTAAKNTALERDRGDNADLRVVQDLMKKAGYPQDVVEAIQLGVDIQLLDQSYSREIAAAGTARRFSTVIPKDFLGSRKAGELISGMSYAMSAPFALTEKVIRLVTYKSAYELERNRLLKERFNGKKMDQIPNHSREAILTEAAQKAQKLTQLTQNEYSLWARPKLFRGAWAPFMLFKSFLQGQLYLSGRLFYGTKREKIGATLYLGSMVYLGGLFGLPGAEDAWELIKKATKGTKFYALGFEKDKGEDLEHAVKDYVQKLLGGFDDPELLDSMFHGFGQYTIPGVPLSGLLYHIIDDIPMFKGTMVESFFKNTPKTDLAQRTTLSSLNLGIDKILLSYMAVEDENQAEFLKEKGVKEALGPLVGLGWDLSVSAYALTAMAHTAMNKDTDAITEKQIRQSLKILPTFATNAVESFRSGMNGGTKDYDGSTLVEYDWSNPNDLYSLVNKGIGFAQTKENQVRERNWAHKELVYYWQAQRRGFYDWYWQMMSNSEVDREAEAKFWKDVDEYNRNAPYAYIIKPDKLKASMKARMKGLSAKEAGFYGPRAIWSDLQGLDKYYPISGTE